MNERIQPLLARAHMFKKEDNSSEAHSNRVRTVGPANKSRREEKRSRNVEGATGDDVESGGPRSSLTLDDNQARMITLEHQVIFQLPRNRKLVDGTGQLLAPQLTPHRNTAKVLQRLRRV